MALSEGFPPPRCVGVRSLRVFKEGVVGSGSDFDTIAGTNSFLFYDLDPDYLDPKIPPGATGTQVTFGSYLKPGPPSGGGANPTTHRGAPQGIPNVAPKVAWHSYSISVTNAESGGGGKDLEISFDGVNVHGVVVAGETRTYDVRREAGIALRPLGNGAFTVAYRVEAW